MDNLTHTLIGVSIASIVSGRRFGRGALVVGAAVANLPDIDIFIPRANIIDVMTYHRGFTHSVIVETLATPVIAFGASYLVGGARQHWARFGLMIWLCLVTHALIDSLTTYGTQLFWPLNTGPPVAFASIFIIDPLFTLLLLIAVLVLVFQRNKPDKGFRAHRMIFGAAVIYLAIGILGHVSVEARAAASPAFRNMRVFVQPGPLTILYWQVLGLADGHFTSGVTSLWPTCPIDETGQYARSPAPPTGVELSPSVTRLEWFTSGYYSFTTKNDRLAITDLRIGVPPGFGFSFDIAEKRGDRYSKVNPVRAIAGLPRPNTFGEVYEVGWRNLKNCLGADQKIRSW